MVRELDEAREPAHIEQRVEETIEVAFVRIEMCDFVFIHIKPPLKPCYPLLAKRLLHRIIIGLQNIEIPVQYLFVPLYLDAELFKSRYVQASVPQSGGKHALIPAAPEPPF